MNKKSKWLQIRNQQIQQRFIEELAKTKNSDEKIPILSIHAKLAVEFDLSIERIREIVCYRRV